MELRDLFSRINFFQIGFQKCGTTFFENSIYLNHPEVRCVQAAGKPLLEDILLENFGPTPSLKNSPSPIASGIVRMSENSIAASRGNRRIGISVTSHANSGV